MEIANLCMGTLLVRLGVDGAQTADATIPCLDVGEHFAAHETRHLPGRWTVTHKATGLAVATSIRSVWDAIECCHAAINAVRESGLNADIADPAALSAEPEFKAFARLGREIREAYNTHNYHEPAAFKSVAPSEGEA